MTEPTGKGSGVSSCDVSDACDRLGIAAVRSGELRPAWPACPALGGRLITIRLEPGAATPLPELLGVLAAAADRVVLVDLGDRVDVQCWGSVLATAARHFGVRGAVVNGAVRDVEGLRELGFATYARGVYPAAMRGRLELTAVGRPVELEDGVVEPEAFVCADGSGAIFVPGDRAREVLELATELRADEEQRLQAVRDGADPRSVFAPRDGTS